MNSFTDEAIFTSTQKPDKSSNISTMAATYPAANKLQSMVSLYEKVSKGEIMTPKPLPMIEAGQKCNSQQRKRKPDKSSICHLVPEVILQEEPEECREVELKQILNGGQRVMPEVTITPSELRIPSNESMESLSSVMRVRPQRSLSKADHVGSDADRPNSQVRND